MAAIKPRDAALALVIVVGFVLFQVGADWARGVGAILALLGLLVVLGAVATLVYDKLVTDRLDAPITAVRQPALARFLFHDTRSAPLWLAVRLYVGFAWLEAGYHKATGPGWLDGGAALKGYWAKAVAVNPATGTGPITYDWYRNFLQYMLDQQWYTWFGKVIVAGELLVGIGILVGGLVGLAAFFGALLNMSFLLAGSASTNPVLFTLAILLMLAWQVAGYWGADHFLLPVLGAPWNRGRLFGQRPAPLPAPVPQRP
jgi:thiosulfate dehydrogenase [quinone] large subunit